MFLTLSVERGQLSVSLNCSGPQPGKLTQSSSGEVPVGLAQASVGAVTGGPAAPRGEGHAVAVPGQGQGVSLNEVQGHPLPKCREDPLPSAGRIPYPSAGRFPYPVQGAPLT